MVQKKNTLVSLKKRKPKTIGRKKNKKNSHRLKKNGLLKRFSRKKKQTGGHNGDELFGERDDQINIEKETELGSGNFGSILSGAFFGRPCAFKRLDLSNKEEQEKEAFLREIFIHSKLSHPSIIQFFSSFQKKQSEPKIIYLSLEKGDTDMAKKIIEKKDYNLSQALVWLIDIAKGLQFLSKNNIVHRDIKPENILIVGDHAKICDFGLSVNNLDNEYPIAGTPKYFPPECLLAESQMEYSPSHDIYGFGITMIELLYQQKLGENDNSFDISEIGRTIQDTLGDNGPNYDFTVDGVMKKYRTFWKGSFPFNEEELYRPFLINNVIRKCCDPTPSNRNLEGIISSLEKVKNILRINETPVRLLFKGDDLSHISSNLQKMMECSDTQDNVQFDDLNKEQLKKKINDIYKIAKETKCDQENVFKSVKRHEQIEEIHLNTKKRINEIEEELYGLKPDYEEQIKVFRPPIPEGVSYTELKVIEDQQKNLKFVPELLPIEQ